MKKVLFVVESLSGGGAEKMLATLVKHLDRERFDVSVCSVIDCGIYAEEIKPYVYYHYILPDVNSCSALGRLLYKVKYKLVYRWLPLSWIYRLFIPKQADVEVAFLEGFATKILSYSCNKKAKKIAWVHSDFCNFHWTRSVYKSYEEENEAYKRYTQIITVSYAAETSFEKMFASLSSCVLTCLNPIDNKRILKKASKIEMKKKDPNVLRIVTVGRLTEVKAYDRLLRIALKLRTEGYTFELWILGDGEQREMLESFIKEKNLSDIVTLWGFQLNPYAYLKQCDLFVCSSLSEGYSTAVTEALILGLPVVTTDCSGMSELLQDGKCGIITDNDEKALYHGIKKMLDEPAALRHYQQEAMLRGKDFSLEALMKPIERILAE